MEHTKLDLTVAKLMFPILVELAPSGNTISYKEIANLIKAKNPDVKIIPLNLGRKLGIIWELTKAQGCPHIGSLVVGQGGECGIGITSIVKNLPLERKKVKEFDWSSVSLRSEIYITKAKIQKNYRKKRRKKLKVEEAKKLFFSYWKDIKEEAPLSRDEAIELKDRTISLIQEGMSPEESLAKELIKFFESKEKKKTPEYGYVYVGEYVDSESKNPLFKQLKIGYTTNIESRAAALSGGVVGPLEFSMKYYWEFDSGFAYAIEQNLHGIFSHYRKKGEFFTNIKGLLAELANDEITANYSELLRSSNFEITKIA